MTTLVLVVLACGVGTPLLLRYVSGRIAEDGAANQGSRRGCGGPARKRVAQMVVAEGDREIPDSQLGKLANDNHVAVFVVERAPSGTVELRVVIKAVQHYLSAPLFGGTSDVVACYEVVFAGLGTAAAQYGHDLLVSRA